MWGTIITVGLEILSWFLKRSASDTKVQKAFFEFVKKAATDFTSIELMESGDIQLKQLKDEEWTETK